MDAKLVPGQPAKVEVRIRQDLYQPWFPQQPTTEMYEGIVQRGESYDGQDTFRMTAKIPQGVRVVALRNVVSINGEPYSHDQKPINKTRTFDVPGSKPGTVYKVTLDTMAKWHCPCSGFSFRGNCSHIDKVRTFLEPENEKYRKTTA